jgi:hypothetical protein
MSDEPNPKKPKTTSQDDATALAPLLDAALWRIGWSYLDMSEAAHIATVSRLFAEAPRHCVRLTVDDSHLLTPAFCGNSANGSIKTNSPPKTSSCCIDKAAMGPRHGPFMSVATTRDQR